MAKRKRIAPRLTSGLCRVSCGHGLPPNIKKGLQLIAYQRGQSLSWVLEQELIAHFGLKTPDYKAQR